MENQAIDYEFWKFVITVINFFGLIFIGLYSWFKQRGDKTDTRFKELSNLIVESVDEFKKEHKAEITMWWKHHDALKDRVIRLESRPQHDKEIGEIHKRINSVAAEVKQMQGSTTETNALVKRINEYLINKG